MCIMKEEGGAKVLPIVMLGLRRDLGRRKIPRQILRCLEDIFQLIQRKILPCTIGTKSSFVYCDGGSFAGNNDTVTTWEGHDLYFRGFRILQAYRQSLISKYNLAGASEVVISGCSAGGLATYLHLDWWAAHVPHGSKVRGLPDSGFFLDYDSTIPGGPKYGTAMRWVFQQMNATDGVNQRCISANRNTPEKCFFAEHTSPFVSTPFFPLQSIYDAWQTGNILGSKDDAEINAFGKILESRFKANVLAQPRNGAFLDSCHHHCGDWNQIVINGDSTSKAFNAWYTSGKGTFIQQEVYPCDSCCKP